MKDLLFKLSQGQTLFDCQYNGVPNKCTILQINLETETAYVRLETAVDVEESVMVPDVFANSSDDYHFERTMKKTNEIWLTI